MSTVRLQPSILALLLLAAGCGPVTAPSVLPAEPTMDDYLARDFRKDGKYDEAGHPLNATVFEAKLACNLNGSATDHSFITDDKAGLNCVVPLPRLPYGASIANVRLRPIGVDFGSAEPVVKVQVKRAGSDQPDLTIFDGTSFVPDRPWTFVPVKFWASGDLELRVETFGRGAVEIESIEIFRNDMQLTLGPGSKVLADEDTIMIETPKDAAIPTLTVNGADFHLASLVGANKILSTETTYRRVYTLTVGQLAQSRTGDLDVRAHGEFGGARMQVYRGLAPCNFEGDGAGAKVLLTGFQPFPAGADHENVSEVAVRALDASLLHGVRVMRMVLPVEWDLGPARVTEAMERCKPDVVVDLGQGRNGIDLEHVAANLKDAGNDDNRGHFQAGVPIVVGGEKTLPSGLPTAVVKVALDHTLTDHGASLGEVKVEDSDDAGHYICNDTFYSTTRAAATLGIRAGFIHLPYTSTFSDEQRTAWGRVAAAIVQAVVATN